MLRLAHVSGLDWQYWTQYSNRTDGEGTQMKKKKSKGGKRMVEAETNAKICKLSVFKNKDKRPINRNRKKSLI